MGGKLSSSAEKHAQVESVYSYIIEVRPGKLDEMFEYIKELDFFTQYSRHRLFLRRLPRSPFARPPQKIPEFNYILATLPQSVVFELAEHPDVIKIYSNELIRLHSKKFPVIPPEGRYEVHKKLWTLEFTTTMWTRRILGAEKANRQGFTGAGIRVSIIDTGICEDHPQLRGVRSINLRDPSGPGEEGHGTAMATIIGGTYMNDERLARVVRKPVECVGMAPETVLIPFKAASEYFEQGDLWNIVEAISLSIKYEADVINMSFGVPETNFEKPDDDPMRKPVETAVHHKIIPVASIGNEGFFDIIDAPGSYRFVVGVGSYDPLTGEISEFSSGGYTLENELKPDIVMPGEFVYTGACGIYDFSEENIPEEFATFRGTSFATAHASGIIALMRQAHFILLGKKLTVDEIFKMLSATHGYAGEFMGYGVLTWFDYEEWLETEYGIKLPKPSY